MAGVRLEFAQFGHFEYFNIYRNSVSTAIENLGQPIGISSTMYYEDLTVEPNRDYYYRAGAIRDSVENFSEEFHVKTLIEFDPPYDLVVEFKNDLTNRLELNWDLDGFVDEQRYYCSETPIDPENLPAPKAVFSGDARTYIDTAVDVGKTYYVCVGSVKNGVEKLSDIKVLAPRIYHVWLEFNAAGIVKKGTSAVNFSNSGCTFQQMTDGSYAAKFTNQNTYLFSNAASQVAGDYELEYVYTPLGWSTSMSPIYDSRQTASYLSNGVIHGLQAGGARIEHRNASGAYTGWSEFNVTPNLVNGTKYKITLRRVGNIWTMLLDDVVVGTSTDPSPVPALANQTFIGRVKDANSGYHMNGYLHRWSIRKL